MPKDKDQAKRFIEAARTHAADDSPEDVAPVRDKKAKAP